MIRFWSHRLLLGTQVLGPFWFAVNNLMALLLLITASVLILVNVTKTPTFLLTRRFRALRRYRSRAILIGLYLVPVGALLINGFLLTLFLTWVWLDLGWPSAQLALTLIIPHGMAELFALILAASLGLAYLEILTPLVRAERWQAAAQMGKELLTSRTTLFIGAIILTQLIFSGLIEGALAGLIESTRSR
jgi:hypothetical protein